MGIVDLPSRQSAARLLDVPHQIESTGDRLVDWVSGSGIQVATTIALAVAGIYALRRLVPVIVRSGLRRHRPTETDVELQKRVDTLVGVFEHTATTTVVTIAVLTMLPVLGLNITPLLTGFGIGGLALGLGAQSLVRDVINGVFILMEDQYGKGDVVRVAGVSGLVESVNLRRTVLRDLDGHVHTIPNGQISVVTNMTDEWSRVNLDVSVAYDTDIDHAMDVINRVGNELAQDAEFGPLITEAPQALRVDRFDESAIVIKVLGVTLPIHQWTVAGELRKRLKHAFDREGAEIPFPHRVLITRGAAPARE